MSEQANTKTLVILKKKQSYIDWTVSQLPFREIGKIILHALQVANRVLGTHEFTSRPDIQIIKDFIKGNNKSIKENSDIDLPLSIDKKTYSGPETSYNYCFIYDTFHSTLQIFQAGRLSDKFKLIQLPKEKENISNIDKFSVFINLDNNDFNKQLNFILNRKTDKSTLAGEYVCFIQENANTRIKPFDLLNLEDTFIKDKLRTGKRPCDISQALNSFSPLKTAKVFGDDSIAKIKMELPTKIR